MNNQELSQEQVKLQVLANTITKNEITIANLQAQLYKSIAKTVKLKNQLAAAKKSNNKTNKNEAKSKGAK